MHIFYGPESRARKSKNWEDADFYDSDDDTFLDRTGDIEKKRQKRILRVKPVKRETENFETLVSVVLLRGQVVAHMKVFKVILNT